MTMGDRVAVMREGVLQQLAAPQELYDHPTNLFVASFMGSPSMNLYAATVTGSTLKLGSQQLQVTPRPGLDGRVVVGVRPEHLTLPAGDGQTLTADVELVEALGNEQLVHFTIDAPLFTEGVEDTLEEDAPASVGIARVAPGAAVGAGSKAMFAVEVDRLHFFDRQSGAAIA
jgi:multiple sugar transport system ATP-binding protein